MRRSYVLLVAFTVGLGIVLAWAPPLWAQEATPGPGPSGEATETPTPTPPVIVEVEVPTGPSADEIGEATSQKVLAGIGQVFLDGLEQGFPTLFGNWLGQGVEHLLRALWDAAAFFLGPINIFTQLPDLWTYDLPAVALARDRLLPLAAGLVTLGTVLTVLLAGLGTLVGRPFGWLLTRAPRLLLVGAALVAAPQLMAWWIRFCNALSGALLDPLTGLPGLGEMTAVGQLVNLGWVALLYAVFALWFLFQRLVLLVAAALCLAVMPLAVTAGVLPLPQAERFFAWWLSTFVGVVGVQVLQAVCLGIGANVILVGGSSGEGLAGGAQEALAGLVGAGSILAAGTVPPKVLGALARPGGPPGVGALAAALRVAGFAAGGAAAGAGWAWVQQAGFAGLGSGAAGATGAAGQATVQGVSGGYVRSLLGSGPPLALPPPRD